MSSTKNIKHAALIGGTAYEITGGKAHIAGTAHNISKGRTLINGTGYDITFGTPCTLTLDSIPSLNMSSGRKETVIKVDGESIDISVATHDVEVGQTVTIDCIINTATTTSFEVIFNGATKVDETGTEYTTVTGYGSGYVIDANGGWESRTYTFILAGDTTIKCSRVAGPLEINQTNFDYYTFTITDTQAPTNTLTITGTPNDGYVVCANGTYKTTGSYKFFAGTKFKVYTGTNHMGITMITYNGSTVANSYNVGVNYTFTANSNITISYGINGNTATITTS